MGKFECDCERDYLVIGETLLPLLALLLPGYMRPTLGFRNTFLPDWPFLAPFNMLIVFYPCTYGIPG